jgi:hypothetical protein
MFHGIQSNNQTVALPTALMQRLSFESVLREKLCCLLHLCSSDELCSRPSCWFFLAFFSSPIVNRSIPTQEITPERLRMALREESPRPSLSGR